MRTPFGTIPGTVRRMNEWMNNRMDSCISRSREGVKHDVLFLVDRKEVEEEDIGIRERIRLFFLLFLFLFACGRLISSILGWNKYRIVFHCY